MYRGAAVGVALLAAVGAAVAQTWPSIPAQYSAVVSANVVETGYTLSYSEYWDGAAGRLRVDGRYVPTYYAQIWDFNTKKITQWPTSDPFQCNILDFSPIPDSFMPRLRDSLTQWWSPAVAPTFVGYSTAARTINCAVWSAPDTDVGPGYNETATEYYYVRVSDNAPVRMERVGTRWTQNTTDGTWRASDLHEYVDWVMFMPGAPEPRWFSVPYQCPASTVGTPTFPLVPFPTASTVTPQPTDLDFPLLSSNFRLVLESKLTTTSQTVTSMRWYVDMGKNKERLDYIGDGGKLVQLVYDYSQTPNILWNATLGGSCVTSYASAANASPLYARAGSLPALFKRYGWFSKPPGRYEGRTVARGVASDSFVQRQQLVNDYSGAVFDFDMHVMFFPKGWQFPGREGMSDASPPLALRIANNGTMKPKTGANQTYSDVWDIFQLIPTEQDVSLFAAVDMWGCAPLPPQPEETHATSKAGTIAGAIVGVVLGLALAYGAYRWWRSHRGTFHANIQGMTKADDTTTTGGAQA